MVGMVGGRGRRAAGVLIPAAVCVAAFGYGLPSSRRTTACWARCGR